MEIALFNHREIDRQQWNDFILESPQGAIYAMGEYLDILDAGWEAFLITKGEKWIAVMPWFQKRKWGIAIGFQPALCQFLGLFFQPLSTEPYKQLELQRKVGEMLAAAISNQVAKYECNFSPAFQYPQPFIWQGFQVVPRFTYFLNLREKEAPYSEHHRRILKKAENLSLHLRVVDESDESISFFRQHMGDKVQMLNQGHFDAIEKIVATFGTNGLAQILECRNEKDELLATMLTYNFKGTYTYYMGSSSSEGRKIQAMTWLMHQAIGHARQLGCDIFDFEGSMIENVERFFRGFGAMPKPFYTLKKSPMSPVFKKF